MSKIVVSLIYLISLVHLSSVSASQPPAPLSTALSAQDPLLTTLKAQFSSLLSSCSQSCITTAAGPSFSIDTLTRSQLDQLCNLVVPVSSPIQAGIVSCVEKCPSLKDGELGLIKRLPSFCSFVLNTGAHRHAEAKALLAVRAVDTSNDVFYAGIDITQAFTTLSKCSQGCITTAAPAVTLPLYKSQIPILCPNVEKLVQPTLEKCVSACVNSNAPGSSSLETVYISFIPSACKSLLTVQPTATTAASAGATESPNPATQHILYSGIDITSAFQKLSPCSQGCITTAVPGLSLPLYMGSVPAFCPPPSISAYFPGLTACVDDCIASKGSDKNEATYIALIPTVCPFLLDQMGVTTSTTTSSFYDPNFTINRAEKAKVIGLGVALIFLLFV
ncbi:hypothetical protein BCR33DRAFT_728715 [Rhizoclosmatium globosum]|uniref:FZ domain-containing protein n=1 Tax=Rhizoclosmatium globosum TaxID=329046 RepID=A0A1Y2AIX2_9FUNG|nr:hypothetical protein BCR33DRAFT_728715 [Rhizoclosmatium globosum]|eukprot:ORY22533.1 hypothetical protein BCR33DRAFT_728715 [Rhizoclosmatium globosum]